MIRSYLDNNATTRPATSVVAAMMPYLTELYVNPSSAAGRILGAAAPMAGARTALARLFGVAGLEDCFHLTSGASEANSWAVLGAMEGGVPGEDRILTSEVEHPSVEEPVRALADRGFPVDVVGVDASGLVRVEDVLEAVRPTTRLVCVMLANNETGVVQPVGALAQAVRALAPNVLVHCDATQAAGRIPVDLAADLAYVDTMSISAHKFHGPKGVGALFMVPGLELPSLVRGAGRSGRRGGTPDAAAAAGLAEAADLALRRLPAIAELAARRDRMECALSVLLPGARINGGRGPRLPNTISVTMPGIDAAHVVDALANRGVCVAMGSACSHGATAPSRTLIAMGLSAGDAASTLRLSMSHDTTDLEIEVALAELRAFAR